MMHLAMISKNGTIWDTSLNERMSPSKKYLLKLPNSCGYHGYSDDKGILYFIDGRLRKVTQYHSSINKNGHKIVTKLQNPLEFLETPWNPIMLLAFDDMCYLQSLQIGNNFWMFVASNTYTLFEITFAGK